jgi:predicted lactoylglutathione lyase
VAGIVLVAAGFVEWGDFSIVQDTRPISRDVHVAFAAAGRAEVDAFHRAGVEAGYRDNGPPAERPVYHRGYYGAYLLDPDGNNIEAVHRGEYPAA